MTRPCGLAARAVFCRGTVSTAAVAGEIGSRVLQSKLARNLKGLQLVGRLEHQHHARGRDGVADLHDGRAQQGGGRTRAIAIGGGNGVQFRRVAAGLA